MNRRMLPYLFLIALIVILVFILGVRYGSGVSVKNQVVQFVLSLTPTPNQPTALPTLTFMNFENKHCGLRFTYPSFLLIEKESTTSASFAQNSTRALSILCDKKTLQLDPSENERFATQEVTLKNQKITSRVEKGEKGEFFHFQIKNPRNGKVISVTVEKNLFPLFEKTVEFLP